MNEFFSGHYADNTGLVNKSRVIRKGGKIKIRIKKICYTQYIN